MDQITPAMDFYLAEFARVEQELPGADAAMTQRKAELRTFVEHGFPTKREEDWKYTDLKALTKLRLEIGAATASVTAEQLAAYVPAALDAYRAVIVDGRYDANLSQLDGLPAGAHIGSFATHLNNSADATVRHTAITDEPGSPAAMNAAFATDGVHVELERNTVLDKPLHVITLATGAQDEAMHQVRHRYELHDNSQLTVIEHYIGLGDGSYFTNAVTEAITHANSQLTRCRLQEESTSGFHISALFAQQERDSRLFNHSFDLGAKLARIDTNSRLIGPNSQAEFYGVYAPSGKQHVDNHTRVDHATEHGTSREVFKGVLSDSSHGVFNGKVVVHKYAQKTDSDQSTAALLLSKKAEIDAKPELEIYADDVKCAHGSTIGQLDEDAVFYLRSRGISETGARAILTYSFARELVQMLQLKALEQYIEARLMAKLPGGESFA